MKKGVLILVTMCIMVSTINASTSESSVTKLGKTAYYDEVVTFVERGIEFNVYLNGAFDFNTSFQNSYFDYHGNRIARNGMPIFRDRRGRVTRVGNVIIRYNFRGNVTRIGSVFLNYQRGYINRVGDLHINYRYGNPYFYGQVHYNNNNYYYGNSGVFVDVSIGDVCDYNDTYFYRRDFRTNYSRIKEDNNYYYYRANTNAKIGKRSTIIKRRKPSITGNTLPNAKRGTLNNNNNNTKRTTDNPIRRSYVIDKNDEARPIRNTTKNNLTRRNSGNDTKENNLENRTRSTPFDKKIEISKSSENTVARRNTDQNTGRQSSAIKYGKRNENAKRTPREKEKIKSVRKRN